jgi:hypothetical protein
MKKENRASWLALAAVGGLLIGATGCGGGGGHEEAPGQGASAEPSGAKHHCNADHGCSGDMDKPSASAPASAAVSAAPASK